MKNSLTIHLFESLNLEKSFLSPDCPFLSLEFQGNFILPCVFKEMNPGTQFAKIMRKMKMEFLKIGKKGQRHHLVSVLTERRKHPRIPLRLPTEYFPEGTIRSRLCYTINIGEGGVLLCLPEKPNVGQRLKMEVFYYFDYELTRFIATGEVVWAEKSQDSPTEYQGALEFVDLSLRDFEKLKNFLGKIFY